MQQYLACKLFSKYCLFPGVSYTGSAYNKNVLKVSLVFFLPVSLRIYLFIYLIWVFFTSAELSYNNALNFTSN